MNLPQIVIIIVFVLSISDVSAWFRRRRRRRRRRYVPPPCSWSTCRHEWRNDWSPSIQTERCVSQNRQAHHIYTTHNGVGLCPSTTYCIPQTQSRKMCSCKHTYQCSLLSWNTWSGSVTTGSCGQQSRYRDYNPKIRYDVRADNCNGIPSTCGNRQYGYRTWCSCKHTYQCSLLSWTTWSGSVTPGSCGQQSRYRDYNPKIRYDVRADNCNGIPTTCGNRQYGYRTWCSCRFASCSLGAWSSWSDLPSPVSNLHCASQERSRTYVLSWSYTARENNCNGVGPQSCPADLVEHRKKIITCPALPSPAHGNWDRDDCHTKPHSCRSICQMRCDVINGFQLKGADTRKCLPSGQWSTPWTSYCQDVNPPSITCPQPISVGTDPGKPTAKVQIPNASATDNSGQQPQITNDAGASQKDFVVNSTPYEVKYTAIDAAGLTSTCALQITVKDLERPRMLSCPDDIKHETNRNEIRVMWPYPEFEDNFDRPPVQLRITSNRNPGVLFPWGRYEVVYTATDRAGNSRNCKFFVEVGPVKCTYFEAPAFGIRACNVETGNANNVRYEMICAIQCKDGYSFADPQAANTYICQSDGTWTRLMFGGQLPVPVHPKSQRPWPDCVPEKNPDAVKKEFTFYAGSCSGDEQEALMEIKKNFLEAVKSSPLAKYLLCDASDNLDCVMENVKVYCGANSKRSVDNTRIVKFNVVLKDTNPTPDRIKEAAHLSKCMQELDELEKAVKEKFARRQTLPVMKYEVFSSSVLKSVKGVSSKPSNPLVIQVQSGSNSVACPEGQVAIVRPGQGSELERSVCVECPPGKYYNTDSQTCEICQDGTFQNRTGQTSCHACPDGMWTAGSHIECFDICRPGEYTIQKDSGIVICLMCPIGTYQPNFRADNCIPCPSGKTTGGRGATDTSDCH